MRHLVLLPGNPALISRKRSPRYVKEAIRENNWFPAWQPRNDCAAQAGRRRRAPVLLKHGTPLDNDDELPVKR